MRLVLVYQHFMTSGVGSTKPYDLARSLVSKGHDVTVICGRGYLSQGMSIPPGLVRLLEIDGIKVICVGVSYHQGMGFARRLLSFGAFTLLAMVLACLLPRYDLLLASSTPLTVGLVGLAARYVRRIPYVFEVRDLWPEVPAQAGYLRSRVLLWLATFLEEWSYRQASAVCAISQRMCQRLIQRGVRADKVFFIPTGVNCRMFETSPNREYFRRHNLEGCWIATYLGSHGRVNHLDYALDAAEHLRDQPQVRIVLIGAGSEKRRLQTQARTRGLDGATLVFLDPVPRSEVPGILLASDALLMLNSSGPGMQYLMTNKFFDYLAAGRPIVVNVKCELTDWVLGSGCGLLTDPSGPEDLARALVQLKGDPNSAAEMGRRGADLARTQFDRAILHDRWEGLLAQASRKPLIPAGGRRSGPA